MLIRAVRCNTTKPFRFYCVTDDGEGLDPEIVALPIPETGVEGIYERKGRWPKLSLFKRDLFPGHTHAIYFDLDVMIMGSIDPFIDRIESEGGLHILREWNSAFWNHFPLSLRPHRGAQSSIFAWTLADYYDLYDRFVADPQRYFSLYKNDQEFTGGEAKPCGDWPVDWTVSFRRHCVPHFPLNFIWRSVREPVGAKIVIFHGKPQPSEVVREGDYSWGSFRRPGRGPVDWVRRYWLKYSDKESGVEKEI